MIHEATHAWQESFAVEQAGKDAMTLSWLSRYNKGLERQAIDVTQSAHDSGRIRLSPDAYRRQITMNRAANAGGMDSPIVLRGRIP